MSELHGLQQALAEIIPDARLERTALPGCEPLALYLLNADYAQDSLSPQAMQRVMDNPLYWVFCWA